MLRRLLIGSAVAVSGFATAIGVSLDGGSASAASISKPLPVSGVVVGVRDGDTLEVLFRGGRRERVHLLGVEAPDLVPRECHAAPARSAARRLALGKRVRLAGDKTYGRGGLFVYVRLPNGADLGRALLRQGHAAVMVGTGRAFLRLAAYRSAERLARERQLGVWSCAGTTADAPAATRTAPPTATTGAGSGETTANDAPTTPSTTTLSPTPTCHMSFPDMCSPPIAP